MRPQNIQRVARAPRKSTLFEGAAGTPGTGGHDNVPSSRSHPRRSVKARRGAVQLPGSHLSKSRGHGPNRATGSANDGRKVDRLGVA